MALNWQVFPYEVPLKRPLQTAAGVWRERRGWFLRCATEAAEGLGEAAPLEGWGSESFSQAAAVLRAWPMKTLAPDTVGDIPGVLARYGVSQTESPAVYAGLELAMLDWLARRMGLPLARVFSEEETPFPSTLETSALIGAMPPLAAAERARACVEEGFRTLKVKLNGEDDWGRVAAVREAIGPTVALRLDVNGMWPDVPSAHRALAPFSVLAPEFVEQPLPASDFANLALLARQLSFPVAADEGLGMPEGHASLLNLGVPIWVFKPMATGGLLHAMQWRARAQAVGIRIVWSSVLDLGVASLGVIHLAASDENPLATGLGTTDLYETAYTVPEARPMQGRLAVSPEPGLGIRHFPQAAVATGGGVT